MYFAHFRTITMILYDFDWMVSLLVSWLVSLLVGLSVDLTVTDPSDKNNPTANIKEQSNGLLKREVH